MKPEKIIPIDHKDAEPEHTPEKRLHARLRTTMAAKRMAPEVSLDSCPAPHGKTPHTRYIFQYALILLCVAFVLVLLSYLSHQQQQWADIQEEHSQFSVSAMQSIQTLQEENTQYEDVLSRLRRELDAMTVDRDALLSAMARSEARHTADLESLREDLEHAENTAVAAEKQREALEYLWRAEALAAARKYAAARSLLTEMREKGLPAHLTGAAPDGLEETAATASEEYARLAELLFDD